MRLMLVFVLFLTLQPVSATGSSEEVFFSDLLMAARRGDYASFKTLVHPSVLSRETNSAHMYSVQLKEWARGIIHGEIMSISVLSNGTVRLSTHITRRTLQGLQIEPLLLDTTPGPDGLPRLLSSNPHIIQ